MGGCPIWKAFEISFFGPKAGGSPRADFKIACQNVGKKGLGWRVNRKELSKEMIDRKIVK